MAITVVMNYSDLPTSAALGETYRLFNEGVYAISDGMGAWWKISENNYNTRVHHELLEDLRMNYEAGAASAYLDDRLYQKKLFEVLAKNGTSRTPREDDGYKFFGYKGREAKAVREKSDPPPVDPRWAKVQEVWEDFKDADWDDTADALYTVVKEIMEGTVDTD